MKYGHLERIEVKLRTLSPVFIGSGESLTKKEYIYDKADNKIYIPDLVRLTNYLNKLNLLHAFEKFLIHPQNNDLYAFLSNNKINKSAYPNFVRYSIDAGEVAYEEKFRELLTFMKGPDGRPFIPGSSLKGAIRTAIAAKLIENGNFEHNINELEKAIEHYNSPRRYAVDEARNIESKLFCRLNLRDIRNPDKVKWFDQVNDFMRGIQVSDSAPIDYKALTICCKYDRKPDGSVNHIPIYRECLAPGTSTSFIITMDMTFLSKLGINVGFIKDALSGFADMQHSCFDTYYSQLPEDADTSVREGISISLGGGTGYITKTIVYPLVKPRQKAVKLVEKMMIKQFPSHYHHEDSRLHKISPHTIKTTMYKGRYYPMGRCEIFIQ